MPDAIAPLFARIRSKLERSERELSNLKASLDKDPQVPAGLRDTWGRTTRIAAAVHNVYNGMEDVMVDVAKHVDGGVPTGDSSHQELLDQMAIAVGGARDALLDEDLYRSMIDLKGFRHLVRHRYGLELDPAKVEEKLTQVGPAFARFEQAVQDLIDVLSPPTGHEPK